MNLINQLNNGKQCIFNHVFKFDFEFLLIQWIDIENHKKALILKIKFSVWNSKITKYKILYILMMS